MPETILQILSLHIRIAITKLLKMRKMIPLNELSNYAFFELVYCFNEIHIKSFR